MADQNADRMDERARADAATRQSAGAPRDARLVPLDDLHDYTVARGEPDVRGWDVKLEDGTKIGDVHRLIVDPTALEVRYLDVTLDKRVLSADHDRHVLVPIGAARLDDAADVVFVRTLARDRLPGLPEYDHGPISRQVEDASRTAFAGTASAGAEAQPRGDYYAHEHFDQNRFFGKRREQANPDQRYITLSREELALGTRRVESGEVDVRKHVETEHVRKTVPVTHEEVQVERRPASPDASAAGELRDQEIRVPLMAEEAVVEKRVVPQEEIAITKRAVAGEQTVEADVRRERVDVDRNRAAREGKQQSESEERP